MHRNMRGVLAGYDIEDLKARTAQEPYRSYWESMVARWHEIVNWQQKHPEITWQVTGCGGRFMTPYVVEAGLIALLDHDQEAVTYVEKQIDLIFQLYDTDPEALNVTNNATAHPYFSSYQICMAADICWDQLSPNAQTQITDLVRNHITKPNPALSWNTMKHYLGGNNIPVTAHISAGICALIMGERSGLKDWEQTVQLAKDSCILYSKLSIDSEGYLYEGPMYGLTVLGPLYIFADLLKRNDHGDLMEESPVLLKVPDAFMQIMFPDNSAFLPYSDGGLALQNSFALLLWLYKETRRPEILSFWNVYRGPGCPAPACKDNHQPYDNPLEPGEDSPCSQDMTLKEILPFLWLDKDANIESYDNNVLPTAIYSKGVEIATFRSSWNRDAVFMGVMGQGRCYTSVYHGHVDAGHFTIFAYGEYLAIDTGYFNTTEDHHSVVLVDGKCAEYAGSPGNRNQLAGRLEGFQQCEVLDYVMAESAQVKDCIWADRHVMYVRLGGDDAYIVLLDNINKDHSEHSYCWQLQAHPDAQIEITGQTSAIIRKEKARLDVTFVSPPPEDFPECPHRLTVRKDDIYCSARVGSTYTKEEARAQKSILSYGSLYRERLLAEQTGPNGLIMSVISPRRTDQEPLSIRNVSKDRVFRLEIESEQYVDTIIAALDYERIRFPDISGYTGIAFVRRDKSGKCLNSWSVDGSALKVKD